MTKQCPVMRFLQSLLPTRLPKHEASVEATLRRILLIAEWRTGLPVRSVEDMEGLVERLSEPGAPPNRYVHWQHWEPGEKSWNDYYLDQVATFQRETMTAIDQNFKHGIGAKASQWLSILASVEGSDPVEYTAESVRSAAAYLIGLVEEEEAPPKPAAPALLSEQERYRITAEAAQKLGMDTPVSNAEEAALAVSMLEKIKAGHRRKGEIQKMRRVEAVQVMAKVACGLSWAKSSPEVRDRKFKEAMSIANQES